MNNSRGVEVNTLHQVTGRMILTLDFRTYANKVFLSGTTDNLLPFVPNGKPGELVFLIGQSSDE